MPRATCTAARAADGASCASRRTAPTINSLPRRLDGHQHNNPNDLAVDKQGRIWFTDPFNGSAGDQELDHMSVLRLDPAGNGRQRRVGA